MIFPWKIVIFHSYVSHYQRVYPIKNPLNHHFPVDFLWFSYGFPMFRPSPWNIAMQSRCNAERQPQKKCLRRRVVPTGSWDLMQQPIAGWWLGHPSEKYEFVTWDDYIYPIYGKIIQMFQTTNPSRDENGKNENAWVWNMGLKMIVAIVDSSCWK